MLVVKNFYRILVTIALICVVQFISAQSIENASDLYNQAGQEATEGNLETAIQNFEDCIAMCETLYEEEEDPNAEEIMINAKQTLSELLEKLPKYYLNLSITKAKEKDYKASLEYAVKAKNAANEVNDEEIFTSASKHASKLYYSFSLSKYKSKDYDSAIDYLNKSINEDNTNFKAQLLRVVIFKETQNEESLVASTKALMAVPGADENKDKAISLTSNYFYNAGVKAKQASDYSNAIKYIQASFEFNPENADAYYLLASIYNSQENWDKAIAAANEGLKYEESSADAKARFYYELGNSYLGKGDNANACDAYSKSALGVFTENATYQMNEVLKCN